MPNRAMICSSLLGRAAAAACGACFLLLACSSSSSTDPEAAAGAGAGGAPSPTGSSGAPAVGGGTSSSSGATSALGGAANAGASGAPSAGAGGSSGAPGAGAGGLLGGGAGGASGSAGASSAGAAGSGSTPSMAPCDLYAAASTPCVAAHSMVRALYSAYSGNLYQVKRASDNTTKDIAVSTPGGFANAAAQETFCQSTTCTVSIIYDQSPKANHLTPGPGGGAAKGADKPVNAAKSKLMVGGHSVYAAYFEGGMGYRNDKTSGIATGDQPESIYMVTSGTHFNAACCFDYGNAETDNNDDGNGTMEAIYFGNQHNSWGWGDVTPAADKHLGPWVEADLENGLFAGPVFGEYKANTPLNYAFVTAMIKGKPGGFAIKGGDANSGTLKTMYEGARPSMTGYNPMKKQGAIILGIGGDNSNGSQGTFYEGCLTAGYAPSATDDQVQANIIAAGYGK